MKEMVCGKTHRVKSLITALAFTALALLMLMSIANAAPFAYITNYDDNTTSVIDTSNNTVIATVPVGIGPCGVAVNPDGTKAYVTNSEDNTTSVIDAATNTIVATVPVGIYPCGVAVNPNGTKAYVASASNVSVIDTATNNVTATVDVIGPYGIAVSPDGAKVYVANVFDNTTSVIDTSNDTVIATVPVGTGPFGVAVNPNGTEVYVTNSEDNTISVIDAANNTTVATVPVGIYPCGVAVSPDGTKVYVANLGNDTVSVIDTSNDNVTATINEVPFPYGVAVTPDGTKLYVATINVSVVDTVTNMVVATVPVGNGPLAFGQFISGPVTVTDSSTAGGAENEEIKDYLPQYANGAVLHIENGVGSDILVVWTKADSKQPVFKVNIPAGETRTVTVPAGSFDEYVRVTGSWYRIIPESNDGHTQIESGYEYTDKYYWGSSGNGLTPISDNEVPEM
jgi:YVTN family beta-propeller protein